MEQLRTKFVVSADKPLLRYQFAVVLQNPNHRPDQQPGFSMLIRTSSGDTISFSYYEAVARSQSAGFSYQEQDTYFDRLIYRNWTSHVLDLRDYVGQTLRLEVTSHDCGEGGHYGYAYFDAQCLEMAIAASSVCTPQTNLIRLTLPSSFDRHQWSTGDTTETIQVNPQLGSNYWVDVASQFVLDPACRTVLRLTHQVNQLLIPTLQQVSLCAGEAYAVGDSLYTRSGTYRHVFHRLHYCNSILITQLTLLPTPSSIQTVTLCQGSRFIVGDSSYATIGNYITRIVRAAPLCDSLVTTHLIIQQIGIKPLRDTTLFQGDSIQLVAAGSLGTSYSYSWSPQAGLSCSGCANPWASPTQTTYYQLTVRTANGDCEASYGKTVQILPCLSAIPNAFTPNGDGLNDTFRIIVNPCLG